MERVQTILRIRPELMKRVKAQAKKENKSVNAYIENVLNKATGIRFPAMQPDVVIDSDILAMAGCINEPDEKKLAGNPKLVSLWKRYGTV